MIKRISRYEVRAELGRGAFTRVFQAWDPVGSRLVAIKTSAEESEKGLFVYLQNEAGALFRLRHQNIVTIYEWGEYEGTPFIVVEYLEGKTLRQAIADGAPLSMLEKMEIMRQVGEALECAHRSGTFHLDIRPTNVKLLPNGQVKILDFGSVQLTEESATRLARDGYLRASLMYAAPEQLSSAADVSDTLSDVFAYGVIYYELLTGQHPFPGKDEKELVAKILKESPAGVRSLAPDCPKALARVVHRALQKDPKLRYQSVEELQAEVEPILAELRPQGPEAKRESPVKSGAIPWRRWVAVGVPAVCLVAAAGVVVPRFSRKGSAPPVTAAAETAAKPAPLPTAPQPSPAENEARPSPFSAQPQPAAPPPPAEAAAAEVTAAAPDEQNKDEKKEEKQEVAKAVPQQFDPSALLRAKPAPPANAAIKTEDLGPPPDAAATAPSVPGAVALARAITSPAAAPVSAPERVRLGGNFQEPKLISGPAPQMPPLAKERRVYGVVKLEATVTKEGAVKDVKVLSGHPLLSAAAKDAALQRRYQPAMLNGDPLEVKVPMQIVFQPGR